MRRQVKDVMTKTVVVVATETPFKEIARRLSEYRVAALPVVDARDRVVGIVSEADLCSRRRTPSRPDDGSSRVAAPAPNEGRPGESRRAT
jgi:CBS-domain-containing membrane protein